MSVARLKSTGQLVLWPVDDLIADKRHLALASSRPHRRLVECWMCWCDVASGHATAPQVLASGEVGEPA